MYVKRDYTRPFFGRQRRRFSSINAIFFAGIFVGAMAVVLSLRYDQVQLAALEMVGQAPLPTPLASEWARRGSERFGLGDVEGALAMYANAIRQEPGSVSYLYDYGQVLVELDRTEEAAEIAEQAIAAAPNDPRGYALKARALMWSDPTAAVQAAILGIDLNPNFAPLYAASGVAYTNLGRWNEGVRNGRRAVELDPMNAFVQLALNFPLTYIGDYQGAIEAVETAIELNPNLVGPYFYLARLYTLPGVNQPEMAIAVYNRILEMDPDNARAYLRLCETYAGVEYARFDVAQPYCDQAIVIDPTYASAYRQRGQMQYARRNYEGAIESFEQCVQLGSDEIECWYLRGLAHYWLANCDEAWAVLQESKQMALEQGQPESIMDSIDTGLYNITQTPNCRGYSNVPTPTLPPPTSIPATPIGGGFG